MIAPAPIARIRLPSERLADCCWLPRFADKTRQLLAGELPILYRVALGSPLGVDGFFLRHFRLSRADFIRAVRSSADDPDLAKWFVAQPHVGAETIDEWNREAPHLGAKGHPGRGTFLFVRWFLYPKSIRDPRENMFAAIDQDET
jgi:hypothetical protein